MKLTKGSLMADVLMWGGGLIAVSALAFGGFVNSKTEELERNSAVIVQRISVVETESKQYKEDIRDIKMLLQKLNNKIQ